MKKCSYCGLENPDEARQCVACHTSLLLPQPGARVERPLEILPDETRFWQRMTFRDFAILWIRLQALWLFFYAVVDVTYLPSYFARSSPPHSYSPLYTQVTLTQYLALMRIVLHVIAGVVLILWGERVLSWMVKDLVAKTDAAASVTIPSVASPPR